MRGKVRWNINDPEPKKFNDILQMLDLEKEPTLTYVTNVPLSMHDMFKMKNLEAIERKLATFLEQSKFDL